MSKGMTKAELMNILEDLDDDDPVYLAIPTGDHWRHVKVVGIRDADFQKVRESSYTESLILVGDSDPQEDDLEVFVISDSRY